MPNVVASQPFPVLPAVAGKAGDIAADTAGSADFAALLLGQLIGEAVPELLPPQAPLPEQANPVAEAATDPALLLAAMGLTLEPAKTTDSTGTADAAPPLLSASLRPTLPDPSATGADAQAASGKIADLARIGADARATGAAAAAAANTTAAATAAAPANFAAFEPKLAEALAGETSTLPPAITAAAPQSMPARAAGEPLQMTAPLREPAWPAEFAQKIVWMATQDKQNAQITLNPPQIGPIEISLSVKNEQATALFVSGNPEVREAIESALPRLREMLAGVGVELGQTNVSAESFRQAQDNRNGARGNDSRGEPQDDQPVGAVTRATGGGMLRQGNGLVDTFA
ncbi:MAG TPA: flagellar hook-length control protein FliK [Azospira sp.]|nr:flagellar hook-length control protein FliK [Azospira sp.]